MDFHCLSRRELQALCKRNKIPANVTNVAMADSLKALEIVEGIDELLQMCETAQSSIKSGVSLEVASPFVPPTGGRNTRWGNAATPVAPKTNRRKGHIASEEKKDALLTPAPSGVTGRRRGAAKEESAVAQVCGTRRSARLAEKSARLLKVGNENPDFSKKGLFTDDCLLKKGLLTEDIKASSKESPDGLDEISGITDVSAITNLDEEVDSIEKHDIDTDVEPVHTIQSEKCNQSNTEDGAKSDLKESIVVEIKERGAESENLDFPGEDAITIVVEKEVASTLEEVELLPAVEADGAKTELKDSGDVDIEQVGLGSEVNAEFDNQTCDDTVNSEAQETGEEDTNGDAGSEEETDIESDEDDFATDEEELNSVAFTDFAANDIVLEQNNSSETESNSDESDSDILDTTEESAKSNDSLAGMPSDSDISLGEFLNEDEKNLLIYKELPLQQAAKQASPGAVLEDVVVEETEENGNTVDQVPLGALNYLADAPSTEEAVDDDPLPSSIKNSPTQQLAGKQVSPGAMLADVVEETEENGNIVDQVPLGTSNYLTDALSSEKANYPTDAPSSGEAVDDDPLPSSIKNSPTKQLAGVVGDGDVSAVVHQIPLSIAGPDSPLIKQTTFLTPIRSSASKASLRKKRVTAASDNKENIGSGSKPTQTQTKERSKVAKEIAETVLKPDEPSMEQLSKNMKKLNIKNEGEVVVSARPALQVLPDNQKAD